MLTVVVPLLGVVLSLVSLVMHTQELLAQVAQTGIFALAQQVSQSIPIISLDLINMFDIF